MSTAVAVAIPAERDSRIFLLPGTVGFYFAARLCITYLFFQSDAQTEAIVSFALNILLLVAAAFYSFGSASSSLSFALRVLSIVVRGLADTENFDLSLPLWAITLISLTLARSEGLHLDRLLGQAGSPSQLHQLGAKQRSSLKAYPS